MRQLILVRHAKSDRDAPDHTDRTRPLNAQGMRDAPEMARRLRARVPAVDLFAASPAARAQQTAQSFAAAYGCAEGGVRTIDALYTFAAQAQLQALRAELPDSARIVAVFAHNPATSAVARLLAGQDLPELPTCAVARFEGRAESWGGLGSAVCALLDVDTPKRPAASAEPPPERH